jgi:3',5'-cyclic AMP phosphodiesterase CpdA
VTTANPVPASFRLGHVSDLHVLTGAGVRWNEMLINKRLTGYLNTLRHRGRVHRRSYLLAVLAAVAREADHVVVTGDVTNLALEREFEEARRLLDEVARTTEITVIPGNHDLYLPQVKRERRFPHHFARFLESDLPGLAVDLPAGPFPCVKLRGPVAIIALSSAVPRPPFVAAGYLGAEQLEALTAVLAHPEVAARTAVILVHHPPVDTRCRLTRLRDGLVDAAAFRAALAPVRHGLVLFGHLHVRVRCGLPTARGALQVVGASGAALEHADRSARAGFNLYRIGPDGVRGIEARVLDPGGERIESDEIANRPGCR